MSDNIVNTRIKKLSPLLINQLAAGEVVTRPAAVVKELLENAIDAGATHIDVSITQGGMGMIEVADDGEGIHPDDIVMAITRHATSKVADIANLQGISTLGFRGEALSATAAVSRLTLMSSYDNSGIGRQLQVAGVLAETPKLVPVVHNRGTTVTVKDLYFNVPARRGNLKSIATEFNHIETIVRDVALARADVTLHLFHDNKKRLSLSAHSNSDNSNFVDSAVHSANSRLPLARLEQALGVALTDNAIEVVVDLSNLQQQSAAQDVTQSTISSANISSAVIKGWLWPDDGQNANTALPKLLYINGRLIKEPVISNQLRQLAQSSQLVGMGYALYFELPSQWLNLNVHPAKQRIKISPLNNIMAHLNHAVSLKLKAVQTSPTTINTDSIAQTSGKYTVENNFDETYKQKNPIASGLPCQVQEKKQSYQHSIATQPAAPTVDVKNNPLALNGESARQDSDVLTDTVSIISNLGLPQCLDIIASIEDIDSVALQAVLAHKNSLSILPWLLFYSDGQLLAISVQQWQSSLAALFSYNQSFDKHKLPTSAIEINRQIHTTCIQMSKQDALAFRVDIEEILINNAISAIASTQLVALMLFSSAV